MADGNISKPVPNFYYGDGFSTDTTPNIEIYFNNKSLSKQSAIVFSDGNGSPFIACVTDGGRISSTSQSLPELVSASDKTVVLKVSRWGHVHVYSPYEFTTRMI